MSALTSTIEGTFSHLLLSARRRNAANCILHPVVQIVSSVTIVAMSSAPTQALWGVRREVLVPISLDIDIDGVRVVDTFTWDCHQSELSPEEFSRRMTEELGVSRSFVRPIAQSISRQLIDYQRRLPGWVSEGTVAAAAENLQVIDIDVRFRSVIYRDRLEWDVNCLHSSPESFARFTVTDLALPQEMEAAIALTIQQQLCKHRVEMTPSTSGNKASTPNTTNTAEDIAGPRLSSLQPVDQYEFNSQNWKDHRPASMKH